jgi:hypothetical protein
MRGSIIGVLFTIKVAQKNLNDNSSIDLVLRLALLLFSEGTTDTHQPAIQPCQQASRLLYSILAFMPRLYGGTSSLDPFALLFKQISERHPQTLPSAAHHPNDNDETSPH